MGCEFSGVNKIDVLRHVRAVHFNIPVDSKRRPPNEKNAGDYVQCIKVDPNVDQLLEKHLDQGRVNVNSKEAEEVECEVHFEEQQSSYDPTAGRRSAKDSTELNKSRKRKLNKSNDRSRTDVREKRQKVVQKPNDSPIKDLDFADYSITEEDEEYQQPVKKTQPPTVKRTTNRSSSRNVVEVENCPEEESEESSKIVEIVALNCPEECGKTFHTKVEQYTHLIETHRAMPYKCLAPNCQNAFEFK